MSPSGTMARVYTELRRRIMEGDLRPGARLDPAGIGKEMHASITPIRDALHQLKGEGLVESWKHEGFWIAELSEAVIRDRYEWCRDLVQICLGTAVGRPLSALMANNGDYADAITQVLQEIATVSSNQEHWRAMSSLCDRSHLLRRIEADLLDDPLADVTPILIGIERHEWGETRDAYEAFHLRRMELIPRLAASLRSR